MNYYVVGGAVRDHYLGFPPTDRDWVVVGGTPEALLAQGFKPVAHSFPVFLHPETKEEYALARTERKSGTGHTGFICAFSPETTLEEDLARRDLTINAMALDTEGQVIDPYGGMADLKHRILRHVSNAFVEDPLRVLRVARFMARFAPLGFRVAPETQHLMAQMVDSGDLGSLTPERVWAEIERALSAPAPEAFLNTLRACGALAIVLPEIARLYGVPQPPEHHPEVDTGLHIELVLKAAAKLSPDPVVRFAALVHDVGKGQTPPQYWPKHHGHEAAGLPIVQALCQRLPIPKAYAALGLAVVQYHGLVYQLPHLKPRTVLKILKALDAFRRSERVEQFILACRADSQGRPGFEEIAYPQGEVLKACYQASRAISVKDFMAPNMSGLQIQSQLEALRLAACAKVLHDHLAN